VSSLTDTLIPQVHLADDHLTSIIEKDPPVGIIKGPDHQGGAVEARDGEIAHLGVDRVHPLDENGREIEIEIGIETEVGIVIETGNGSRIGIRIEKGKRTGVEGVTERLR